MPADSVPPLRAPGRPRSARADAAILDAAIEILVAEGFGAFSMEALAARAGVGKATVYRRWKSKNAVLVDAVLRLGEPLSPVQTADLRDDLVTLLDQARRKLAGSPVGAVMPRLMSAALDDPDLMRVYWEKAVMPRRRLAEQRLQAAVDAGELEGGHDLALLTDVLFGPVVYRKLFAEVRPRPTRATVEEIVDLFLRGLGFSPRATGS